MDTNILGMIAMAIIIILIIIFGPLITIWALNTLFPVLAIPFNIATWFAVFWLGAGSLLSRGKK